MIVPVVPNGSEYRDAAVCYGKGKPVVIETGKIEFFTDTEIITPGGKFVISNGLYEFKTKDTDKRTTRVSLKSTSDPETDWRSQFALVSNVGSELGGGKFVDQN